MRPIRAVIAATGLFASTAAAAGCVAGRYADAVIHAGATDYVFDTAGGAVLIVRIANEAPAAVGSAPLVARSGDGPAVPAPDRLGVRHLVCIEADGVRFALGEKDGG